MRDVALVYARPEVVIHIPRRMRDVAFAVRARKDARVGGVRPQTVYRSVIHFPGAGTQSRSLNRPLIPLRETDRIDSCLAMPGIRSDRTRSPAGSPTRTAGTPDQSRARLS
jgi:hypothetical protein